MFKIKKYESKYVMSLMVQYQILLLLILSITIYNLHLELRLIMRELIKPLMILQKLQWENIKSKGKNKLKPREAI